MKYVSKELFDATIKELKSEIELVKMISRSSASKEMEDSDKGKLLSQREAMNKLNITYPRMKWLLDEGLVNPILVGARNKFDVNDLEKVPERLRQRQSAFQ